ncbi:MAG TPA: alanine--tRNA ligase-related protein, partial [Acidimicrobiia bacterium]|nr:alanine--tRNA ligase-related protein [Acidimicrobiia bacterium]
YGTTYEEGCRVIAILADGVPAASAREGERVEVVLDRTPFYAEAGGQVGDTGTVRAGDTLMRVEDTQWAIAGSLIVHRGEITAGVLSLDDEVVADVESTRRELTRRNHTGTHLLHWALREVLGEHVRQQGSYVGPDRLRFDFSHFEAVSPSALAEVEAAANEDVLTNAPVRIYETTKEHAEEIGALAFFGDKYGDLVRVVEAGPHSVELCGGTHVHATGSIGPIKVLGESSIGANIRRVEALTGATALSHSRGEEELLRSLASTLNVAPTEVPARVERLQEQIRELQGELQAFRAQQAVGEAKHLAAEADNGVVVVRRDGLTPDDYRQLAVATREALGSGVVVILGVSADPAKAALAAAVSRDLQERGGSAADVAAGAARALGGGTAKNPDVVVGGGKNPDAVDEAVELARAAARELLAARA